MPLADVVTAAELLGPEGPAWFTEVLERAGVAAGAEVVAVEGRAIGTGQVGESVRFTLTWRGGDPGAGVARPATVVGKFPSTDPVSRETARVVQTYEHEIGFYRDVVHRVAVPTPQPFHAAIVDATGDFTLLMNDLHDCVQGDQLGGCSVADAELMVAAAAGLHAPTWGGDGFDALAWAAESDVESVTGRQQLYQMVLPGFVERYGGRLAPEVLETATWLSTHLVDVFVAQRSVAGVPRCMVHGDFRLDNMLFRRDASGAADAVTVVDWQTVALGRGPSDVAYGIGSGLPTEVRRAHERALFDRYCEHLAAGGVPVDESQRDGLWRSYRLGSYTGLAMAVTASMIVGRTERGDEMFCVMAERHAAQMADLAVATLL